MRTPTVCSCINDEEGDLRIHGQLKPLEREQKKHKHEHFIFFFIFKVHLMVHADQ